MTFIYFFYKKFFLCNVISMDTRELEIMTIARELDKRGSFCLLKRYYYKNGKKKRNKPLRFQEVVMIDSVKTAFLEFMIGVFPQEIKKIAVGFRVKYFSVQAVNLLKEILPYLDKKKRQAEIILEFASLKNQRGQRVSPELIEKRISLYKELQKERGLSTRVSRK